VLFRSTAGKTRKFTDTKNIMNYSFKTYDMKNIINEGDYAGVAEISRSKTKQIEFCYPESVSFPLKEEEEAKVLVVPNEIKAPIAKGEQIATVKIYSDYQLLKEFPVFAQENIERHDFKTSLEKVLCEFFGLATWNKTEVCLPEF
jgi:D-alanyl-D-alanine carboxypeptidase (penicillin-binding protein 5/6)